MKCACAHSTDEFHGWECEITGGACAFLVPDSKLCAAMIGEGPEADTIPQGGESLVAILKEDPARIRNMRV